MLRSPMHLYGYHRGPFQFFANLTEELSGMIVLLRLYALSTQPATSLDDSLQEYKSAKSHSTL